MRACEILRSRALTTPHALLQAIIAPIWDDDHANILFAVVAAVKSQSSSQYHDWGEIFRVMSIVIDPIPYTQRQCQHKHDNTKCRQKRAARAAKVGEDVRKKIYAALNRSVSAYTTLSNGEEPTNELDKLVCPLFAVPTSKLSMLPFMFRRDDNDRVEPTRRRVGSSLP
jgi:hypothetical protein